MSRKKGRCSLAEYASMARRIVRSYANRIGEEGEVVDLTGLVELAQGVEVAQQRAVAQLRSHGLSWAYIGKELGTSGQAAYQRWDPEARAKRNEAQKLRARRKAGSDRDPTAVGDEAMLGASSLEIAGD